MAFEINEDMLIMHMKVKINKDMTEAAEPIIQKALKDAEVKMRSELAKGVIACIDKSFTSYGNDTELVIKIDRG